MGEVHPPTCFGSAWSCGAKDPLPAGRSVRPERNRDEHGGDDPEREQKSERDKRSPRPHHEGEDNRRRHSRTEGPAQPQRELRQPSVLPACYRADSHQEEGGRHERKEHRIEDMAGPPRSCPAQRVQKQRVERPEQHRPGAQQQHVIRQQQIRATQREAAAQADLRRTPAQTAAASRRSPPAGSMRMNTPRADRWRTHAPTSARPSDQESAQQREREGAMASNTVQLLKLPRFSVTASEWINAVPTSHGMKEAFSTGSQNHQPPQPSS